MSRDFREDARRDMTGARELNHHLTERALEMRCIAYLAQVKAQLLTDTIFEIDHSRKALFNVNTRLEKEIARRQEVEVQLRDALTRAEEATRLKERFVALVTHDLRGPLTALVANADLLAEDPSLGQAAREVVEDLQSASAEMSALIESLLNLSRIRDGVLRPHSVPFALGDVIGAIVRDHRHVAASKGVTLRVELSPDTRVAADPVLFGEVVRNLVSNAIKFSRPGDTVTIGVPELGHGIVVADTGVGIEPERLTSVFEFGRRTSTPGTAGEVGSGVGLHFVREIVEAHGGEIELTSERGRGTRVEVRLPVPCATSEDPADGSRSELSGAGDGVTV